MRNLIVLQKPPAYYEDLTYYQQFLSELQSYGCGYWKWLRKRRIREVFVINDITNPTSGKIDKIAIKRKTSDSIELSSGKFDIKTGRSLCGEAKYIFPIEDRRVWAAWERQSLRRRVETVLPALRLVDVRSYADLLARGWGLGIFTEKSDRLLGRNYDRVAAFLTERKVESMATCWKYAKEAILGHLPGDIEELRALVTMLESDANED